METSFEHQVNELRAGLLDMGTLAETMIVKSVRALVERSETLVQEVFSHKEEMGQRFDQIDGLCITLLALHHPVASDLHFIGAPMKVNSDLEAIGDLAVNIARTTTGRWWSMM